MFKCHKKYVISFLLYSLYGCHLWHINTQYTFNRIRVGYNDAYRILHSIPRFMSVNEGLVATASERKFFRECEGRY